MPVGLGLSNEFMLSYGSSLRWTTKKGPYYWVKEGIVNNKRIEVIP